MCRDRTKQRGGDGLWWLSVWLVVPVIAAAVVPGDLPIVVKDPARVSGVDAVLPEVWSDWSAWMQARYPQWWERAQREFPRPWGTLVAAPDGRMVVVPARSETELWQGRGPLDRVSAVEILTRLWLYHSGPAASTWWREATIMALMRQYLGPDLPPPGIRPLARPFGGDDPRTARFDALFLDWVERLAPDEWLTRTWSAPSAPGALGLDPIWAYLSEHGQAWAEWLEGFFLHWAGQQYPTGPAKDLGAWTVQPLAALALDVTIAERRPGALAVDLYFDRNLQTRVWVLGYSGAQEVRYYPLAVTGNHVKVVLPVMAHDAYRVVLVHADRSPWAQPLQVRWNIEYRADLPVVLTRWQVAAVGDQIQATWETAQEQDTLRWWVERWDDRRAAWQPAHAVGVPAAGTSFFPLAYHVLLDRPHSGPARYRLRCQLRSGITWTVAVWPTPGEF